MRTPKEIRRKIKDLKYRHLQKLYKKYLSCKPENCKFNFRQPLQNSNDTIGLCIPKDPKEVNQPFWQGTICDIIDDAKSCSRFTLKFSKKQIAKQFKADLKDVETCKEKYKDIYLLEWVLEEKYSFFQKIFRLFKRKD